MITSSSKHAALEAEAFV